MIKRISVLLLLLALSMTALLAVPRQKRQNMLQPL